MERWRLRVGSFGSWKFRRKTEVEPVQALQRVRSEEMRKNSSRAPAPSSTIVADQQQHWQQRWKINPHYVSHIFLYPHMKAKGR
jgi:hypothetical protein